MAGNYIILTVTNDLTYDQRMQRICTTLVEAGYRVRLLGRVLPTSIPLTDSIYEQRRLVCHWQQGKLFYIEYNLRLLWYLLTHRADIYCGIDLDTILPCYIAARWFRVSVVYDAHEYFPEVPEVARRPLIQRLWRTIERFIMPRVDAVCTVSQGIADIFEQQYHRSVVVIRNLPLPLDSMSSPIEATSPPIILYQGSLNEGRGLEQMIATMPHIDAQLWLAGEGDLSVVLRQQVALAGLENRVKFLGYITPDVLRSITATAYIGINLLEARGLNYYHSLANKFFDYMQAGLPQLGMDYPEYRRINQRYEVAILITDLQPETILHAIHRLLSDENLYRKLRENALLCTKELNWHQEQQKLIDIYARLG